MHRTNISQTGKAPQEFLWSEDMADACVFIMEHVDFKDVISNPDLLGEKSVADSSLTLGMTKSKKTEIRNTHINIGSGEEISTKQLAELIKQQVGFNGNLDFNSEKPDGTMRKVTDTAKLNELGWRHKINLKTGIERIINWYKNNDN